MATTYNFLPRQTGLKPRFNPNPTSAEAAKGYGAYDTLSQQYVNSVTGRPWTGPLGNSGYFANNGKWTNVDPRGGNTPQDQFSAVEVLKSPMLAKGTQDLFKSFEQGSKLLDFNSLLNEARQAQGTLRSAAANEQNALNIDDFAARQRALDAQASGATTGYAGTARNLADEYRASDAALADRLNNITGEARGLLPRYNEAAENIAANQLGALTSAVDKYKIGSGMGSWGVGSDELRKIAKGVADIRLPLELGKIQREYDILSGYERPAAQEIATRAAQRISQFESPMERDIYSRVYGDIMNSKNTETMIKQLQIQTAGMSRQAAEAYLRSLALPAQLIAQVLSSQTGTLAGLGALENEAYYRGLQYNPGVNLSQPQGYSMLTPPMPLPPPRVSGPTVGGTSTGTYGVTGSTPGANPVNDIRNAMAAAAAYQQQTGVDPRTDPYFNPDVFNRYRDAWQNYGAQLA